MPRSVRVLESPLLGGPRIVAAVVETRIVLSGTRIALGSPRSTTIRSWSVAAAHTVIVLDRLVVVRHRTAIVDRSIAETIARFAACTVVGKARILSGRRLTLVSDPRVVGSGRLLTLGLLSLWLLTLISEARVVGSRKLLALWLLTLWLLTLWLLTLISKTRIVGDRRLLSLTLVSDPWVVGSWRLLACVLPLVSDTRIVTRVMLLIGNGTAVANRSTVCNGASLMVTIIGNRTTISDWTVIGYAALIGNRSTVCNGATVIGGTLIGSTRIVARMTLVRNRTTTGSRLTVMVALIGHRPTILVTTIGDRPTILVMVIGDRTVVIVTVMTGHCTGPRTSGGTGSSSCTGSGVLVAVRVDVGIELIGALKLAFLFETLLLGKTITFSGVSVQLLGFSLLALSLCGLNLGVGIGLLGLCLTLFGVRFPSMNFMLGLSCLLTDPGGLLALVFALLSCGLTADRDDDADDNQNNDDRNDYPDNGSCTHALSPCCLFGSH
ncbi:hypothetical protein [Brevibacterium aurantiacum]|uniref:Uncharacterized protein n=1 Tax=Brevibacterium aurantiacum TaxID=273384 RepID=A0A556CME8_BREAU|nr:hypothetical protein [Brevibacterium aurantiacum]TSI18613.1 hypothetical protein FO013_03400 [Brevibacterium aurantiacum]